MAMFMLRLSGLLSLHNDTVKQQLNPNSELHHSYGSSMSSPINYNDNFQLQSNYSSSLWSRGPFVDDTTEFDEAFMWPSQTTMQTDQTSENTPKNVPHSPIASPLIASVPATDDAADERLSDTNALLTSDIVPVFPINNSTNDFTTNTTLTPNNSSITSMQNEMNGLSTESTDILNESIDNILSTSTTLQTIIASDKEEFKKDSSSFEYYDFSSTKESLHVPPPLTSYSLVSPVPYNGRYSRKFPSSSGSSRGDIEVSTPENNEANSHTQADVLTPNSNNGQKINIHKDDSKVIGASVSHEEDTAKKIASTETSEVSNYRNNPYPYGPMFLPGYSERSNSDIQKQREHNIIAHQQRQGNTITPAKVDVPTSQPAGEEYEYEYEAYDYKEIERKVQTDRPTVLFHFDGPGYVPEAPSTTPPVVRAPTPSDPWDCAPRCPNYTLVDWNPFYDVRRYPAMTWLSTIIIGKDRVLAELQGYMRLQDYFFGLNDRGQVLNLSVPFITQIKQGRHPGILHELNDFTISLHVTDNAAGVGYELPTPITNEVLINRLEEKTVFVSSFEVDVWEVTQTFLEQKVAALTDRLRSNGEAFVDRYYYLASYSRPELYQPVYYEVWVYATSLRRPRQPLPEPLPRPQMPPLSKLTRDTLQRLCRGVECPSFEVVRSYKYGIQKRRYYDVVFASVSPGDCYFSTLAIWKGFMPLLLYKHGINSQMVVVEATRPIAVVRVKEDSTPTSECPQNLTMSLFLPRRLHSAPPRSSYTAPGPVVVSALEDVMVYAYTVGGYLLDPDRVRKELSDLKYRLSEFGACYRDDIYYIVVYDFISRYHGRQNEIWIVAENCRATHNG